MAWDTGPPTKRVGAQVNDSRSKGMNDGKPGSKTGSQSFGLNVKQGKPVQLS